MPEVNHIMWKYGLRVGKWLLGLWGLSEVAAEVTENVKDGSGNLSDAASNANSAASKIVNTFLLLIGIFLAFQLLLPYLLPKTRRRR